MYYLEFNLVFLRIASKDKYMNIRIEKVLSGLPPATEYAVSMGMSWKPSNLYTPNALSSNDILVIQEVIKTDCG